jgi:hypothetical protein
MFTLHRECHSQAIAVTNVPTRYVITLYMGSGILKMGFIERVTTRVDFLIARLISERCLVHSTLYCRVSTCIARVFLPAGVFQLCGN